MSAPFSNSDALRDGWGEDTAEDEIRRELLHDIEEGRSCGVEICIEQVSDEMRQRYAEVGA
jgi:hypothetical protein